MSKREDRGIKFWNKFAHRYSQKSVPNEQIYQEKLKKTQEFINNESVVLEIGCGTGTTSLTHAPLVKKIDAIDYSKEMIAIANQKKEQLNISNTNFLEKSVLEFDFPVSHYDMIMAHSILHLTQGNENILRNIHSSLKEGGLFVSSCACIKDTPLIRFILPVVSFILPTPIVNIFSTVEFVDLLKKVGFEIIYQWNFKKGEVFIIAKKV